jgi:hypothetical protein
MNNTNIIVITSQDSNEVLSKLQSVFNVTSSSPKKEIYKTAFNSINSKVKCYLTVSEQKAIKKYISKNPVFHFDLLKAFLRKENKIIDNVTLSAYLRNSGYFPEKVEKSGSLITCWKR